MLEINADGTFSAGEEAGTWSRPEANRIKFDKNTELPDAYEWSYAIHDGHLVIAPFYRTDGGTALAGSTWQADMKHWKPGG